MKRLLRFISFTASLVLLLSLTFTAVNAAKEETIELTATTADEWTALFDRKNVEKSWLGGDGIYAVSLDGNDAFGSATKDSKTFFIFSNSLMGTSDAEGNVTWAPGQPSQTSALLTGNVADPDNIEFVWGNGGNREFGWEQHLFGEHKWMLDCFVVKDAVYVFGFPEENWKPKQIDMIKIPIEDNEPKYYKYSETENIPELWYRDGDRRIFSYGIGVMSNTEAAGTPDPELIIRTGGEMRLSNFLLWQSAYSELYVTDTLWPDFDREDIERAFRSFSSRKRRFGGLNPEDEKEVSRKDL